MICRFEDLLKIIKGNFVCELDGKRIPNDEINAGAYQNYEIASIRIENYSILIELKPFESVTPGFNPNDNWVKEYKKQFESEPSFFKFLSK